MPANPHKDEQAARRNLHLILTTGLESVKEMIFIDVVRECLLQYPVSRRFVESFITDFYVAPGHVVLKEGRLTLPEGDADGD